MAQAFRSRITTAGTANGRPIAIAAVASPGTPIFTTQADADKIEEVFVKLMNTLSTAVRVAIQWGGTTTSDLEIVMLDPYETRIVSNQFSSAVALEVRAYMHSGAANGANASAYSLEEDNAA